MPRRARTRRPTTPRRMLAVSVALAGSSGSLGAQAQLPPLAEISGQYLPTSPVPDAGGLRSQVSSYDAAVNVPIRLGERAFLVPGAQYHVDSVSYSHEPAGFTSVRALHSVSFPVLFAQQLSETWTLSFRAWPGLAGDREALDLRAFQVGGLVMATWVPSERVTAGAGVIATYGFGQLLPLPTLYLDVRANPWLRFEASLPAFASAILSFEDRLEVGVLGDVNGNEYSVRAPSFRNAYPCRARANDDPTTPADETVRDPRGCVDHLAYSVIAAGGVARVRLFSSLWLTGFVGHTLFRRYELKSAEGDAVSGGKVDLPNQLSVRAGMVFRIPMPPEAG